MGKLKSINWQELLFAWGDKVVIGVCAIVAGMAIWGGYSTEVFKGDPLEIVSNAESGERTIKANKWPEEETQQFQLAREELPKEIAKVAVYQPIPAGKFEFAVPFNTSLVSDDEPLTEPTWLPVGQMIASESEVIMPLAASAVAAQEDADATDELDSAIASNTTPASDIDEELRVTRPVVPSGGPGSEYGTEYEGYGELGEDPLADDYAAYGGTQYATAGVEAEGRQFVAVRGVFPLRKQVEQIRRAINAADYWEARPFLELLNLEVERRSFRPGSDPTAAEWTPVDLRVAEDVLASSAGLEPDAVPTRITDPVITMPLPARIRGIYGTKATHPAIENFVLSPEELDRELKILSAMSDEIRKKGEDEKLSRPAQAGGFTKFVNSAQDIYSSYSEGFDDYGEGEGAAGYPGGGYPGGGYPGGGYPGGAYPGGGGGYPGAGGGYPGGGYGAPQGLSDQALDAILKRLDPEDRDKGLREWVKKQTTAEEELLLFRYLDFDVEPNRAYQYRVRLEVRNPNYGRSVAEAGGLAHVVEGETRFTPWSEPSNAETTDRTTEFFVSRIREPRGRAPIMAEIDVYQWDADVGTVVRGKLEVEPGQFIGGKKETEVLDPATPSLDVLTYEFSSGDVLLTALMDDEIDRDFHPSLKLPQGAKGGELLLPEAIVYADDAGDLVVVDEVDSFGSYKKRRNMLKLEREQYEHLRVKTEEPTDELGEYYGEGYGYESEGLGEGYDDPYGGGGGYGGPSSRSRRNNPLSRRRN